MNIRHNQSGFALLIFVVVLLGVAGFIGSEITQGRTKSVQVEKMKHDQAVLQMAKQALLGYAVEYHTAPGGLSDMGRLPCPDYKLDITPEGTQDGSCGARYVNISGFLPWKELGLDSIKDSSGECLWYVVSGDYKDSPEARMLNEDTNGLLQVQDENGQLYHGANPDDRPIALIIAPGPALSGQDRTPSNNTLTHCRGKYGDENEYLESGGSVNYTTNHAPTEDTIWTYVYGTLNNDLDNSNYNDRMVWITKSEFWDAIKAQGDLDAADTATKINELTKRLAECLVDYAVDPENNHEWLPWPAAIDMTEYRTNNLYVDQDNPVNLLGRFPRRLTNTNSHEEFIQSSDMTNFLSACLTTTEMDLWKNWKDHFFYVVSEGFEMLDGDPDSNYGDRCDGGKCVEIEGSSKNYAAIVFYADSVEGAQSRNYDPVDPDEKNDIANYLNEVTITKSNAHHYPFDAGYAGDAKKYYRDIGDLTYCIEVESSSFNVTDCTP